MTATTTPAILADEGTVTLPALEAFLVREAVQLGRTYGDYTVTYVGPNFLRLFGDVRVEATPEREGRFFVVQDWTTDEAISHVAGADAELADLFSVLALGPTGPARFAGESNTVYRPAADARWTPHFYTRGKRLGFGALPFGDAVGWEPGDVFVSGVEA
ncbi:hypothetical protein [Microbacterium sp.]|uniref:hypothetical protein n=1 Tax=Microbacterium sp. TaxID=51671 RepID=UPI002FE26110